MICATLQTATACVNSPLNFIHFSLKNMFKKLSKFAKIIGSRNYYFYFCFRGIFLFDSFFCFKLIVSLNKRLKYLPNLFHLLVDNLVNVPEPGTSCKRFTLIHYNSRVIPDWKIPHITTLEA